MASTLERTPRPTITSSLRGLELRARALSDRILWPLGCAISALLLFANLLAAHFTRRYNSDDVALQTVLAQWGRGYHHVATVGADNFILRAPLYLLLGQLTHNGRAVLFLTVLILNAVGFWLFVVSLRYFAVRLGGTKELLVLPLIWLASLGAFFSNILMNPNLRNVEIGMTFALLMLVAKYADGELPVRPARLVLYLVALGLFIYNDPFFLYMVVVPLLLLLGTLLLRDGSTPRVARLVAFLVAGVVAFKVIDLVARVFGFEAAGGDVAFISLTQVWPHLELLIQGTLTIFRADFFSKRLIGFASVHALLGLAVVLAVVAFPFLTWRGKEHGVPWRWFFGLIPAFTAAVFVFSNQTVDLGSSRFLVLVPFLAVLLVALILQGANPRVRRLGGAILLLAAVTNLSSSARSFSRPPAGPNSANYVTIDAARMSGLSKGYAEYWSSNINTYLSGDRIDFIQVECAAPPRLSPFAWLTDDAILRKPASRSFYLYDAANFGGACNRDDVIRQFGLPAEVRPINATRELLVYDYDLAANLGDSL